MYNWTNTKNTNHEIVWTSIPKQFLNATDHLVSPKKYHWAILVHFHCHKPFRCLSPHFCGLKTLNSSSGYGASASDAKPQSDWLHLLVHLSHGDGCPFNWCWGHRVPVSHHPPKKMKVLRNHRIVKITLKFPFNITQQKKGIKPPTDTWRWCKTNPPKQDLLRHVYQPLFKIM